MYTSTNIYVGANVIEKANVIFVIYILTITLSFIDTRFCLSQTLIIIQNMFI